MDFDEFMDTPLYQHFISKYRGEDANHISYLLYLNGKETAGKGYEGYEKASLLTAFVWGDSVQGYDFWSNIVRRM